MMKKDFQKINNMTELKNGKGIQFITSLGKQGIVVDYIKKHIKKLRS